MARGARGRLLAAALPVAAIALAWAEVEAGSSSTSFVVVALLALMACVPALLAVRIAVAALILAGTAAVAADPAPAVLRAVIDRGLVDIYAVAPPFDPSQHPELHVLVLLTAALFCLGTAVTAGSRPFVAAGLAVAGIGWPVTLMPARNTVAIGAIVLLAALWPVVLAGLRDRRAIASGAVAVTGVVAAAVVLAGAGATPSTAALDWQNWNLFGESRAAKTVQLVWSSDYAGIDFPAGKTTVLRVEAPKRARYWRATTLDTFAGDRWVEALHASGTAVGGGDLPPDPLLPQAAVAQDGWVRQDVEVRALVDDHVIGASQPMRLEPGTEERIRYLSGGVMSAPTASLRRYVVWSYAPTPTPASLVGSPPTYPAGLARYLDVGWTATPPFGSPGRSAAVAALFETDAYQPLWAYRPLWEEARRLTAGAESPYEATVAVERWLRATGGFTYDERPPLPGRLPPLVDFMVRTKLGYCQHFAGTMTLMLRYLGIPARVAVGFTSGKWKDGVWTVTDHDAHAWVEAWFAGHGWLAFDPTPGRGNLTATYTNASDSADAYAFLGTGRFRGQGPGGVTPSSPPTGPAEASQRRSTPWPLGIPFAVVGLALAGLGLAKGLRRRRRAQTDDPRRRASAARAELTDFMRDQGVPLGTSSSSRELGLELRRLGVASDSFVAAFSRARYGPPTGAPAAADEVRRELQRILSLLRARIGPARRIRGFVAVRSLRREQGLSPGRRPLAR